MREAGPGIPFKRNSNMHRTKLEKLDLNLLPVLDAILATRSVSKAAAALALSKPATSHALARIRAQIGDPILVRAGQRWVLTERAESMVPHVRDTVRDARALLSARRPFDPKELRREFRIHSTDQMLSLVGLELGHAISRDAPNVGLRFLSLDDDEATALRGDVDLALGVFHDLAPELHTQKLFDDRFVCIARKGHPRIDGKLTLETFLAARHVGVAPKGRPGSVVDAALATRALTRRALRWVPYSSSVIEFVADSDCIATISERLARHAARRFELQILRPPVELPPCAGSQVWHARLDSDPAHAWLRKWVFNVARSKK